MKTYSTHFFIPFILLVVGCLFFVMTDFAKEQRIYTKVPWSVGFWMEGTVTNVTQVDERIQFRLNGRFWFAQYPWGGTNQQVVEVHGKDGISATVRQAEPFFAMTTDWGGGSIRKKGDLLKLLKTASEHGYKVKFELVQPKLDFGPDQSFKVLDASVLRATDVNLQ